MSYPLDISGDEAKSVTLVANVSSLGQPVREEEVGKVGERMREK